MMRWLNWTPASGTFTGLYDSRLFTAAYFMPLNVIKCGYHSI